LEKVNATNIGKKTLSLRGIENNITYAASHNCIYPMLTH